jgi:hypothetical protein
MSTDLFGFFNMLASVQATSQVQLLAMSPTFHIRPATLAASDNKRILAFFDSQLPWLETVGSSAQWGSQIRSTDEGYQEKIRDKIERSEACIGQPYSPNWIRAYIIEAEADINSLSAEVQTLANDVGGDGRAKVPIGGMILEAKSLPYVRSVLPELDEKDPFIYLGYLMSDRRTSPLNKGAGAALIDHGKQEIKQLGLQRFCGDCWAGNDRKLVR